MAARLRKVVLAISVFGSLAENLAEISQLFQKVDSSKPLTMLNAPEVAASPAASGSGERDRSTCRGCDCYHRWMGQDYAGLTYCTEFTDANEASAGAPANRRCLVHDSHCEGSAEGRCGPNCPRYTTNGCECAKSWVQEGHEECHDSCCNPTGDLQADSWCMVTDPACQGMSWGPCSPEPMKHPHVRMTAKGCKCSNGWSVKVGDELEYCHTFCCTPAGLGTLVPGRSLGGSTSGGPFMEETVLEEDCLKESQKASEAAKEDTTEGMQEAQEQTEEPKEDNAEGLKEGQKPDAEDDEKPEEKKQQQAPGLKEGKAGNSGECKKKRKKGGGWF
eukprot:s617_g28.t1